MPAVRFVFRLVSGLVQGIRGKDPSCRLLEIGEGAGGIGDRAALTDLRLENSLAMQVEHRLVEATMSARASQ